MIILSLPIETTYGVVDVTQDLKTTTRRTTEKAWTQAGPALDDSSLAAWSIQGSDSSRPSS